ncbi:unnamed protein product [Sphenostylis stenocarpa]|uniref:Pectinesterase inhibitor domain-containing protein n=1 Tax=Sphenostylis stenocarpa TaxID=92480 RepID=A0AA86VZ10_9FABA|nr:unnamed protein product [Sphenostylis stenocarpa]
MYPIFYISRSKSHFTLKFSIFLSLSLLNSQISNQKMGKFSLLLLLLLTTLHISLTLSSPTNFIKSSCSATQYPALCVESLSVYAASIQQDPHELVQTALSLALNKTESTKTFVTKCNKFRGLKPREYAALKDCAEEISDGVDRLSRSLKELKLCKLKGEDFAWHISNVETWVSSALTDESTCGDGFAGKALSGKMKDAIRGRMVNVAQVTSNALSLINQYAAKH